MKKNFIYSLAGMPKYIAGFIASLIFRLLSPFFGLWNVSPLMATEFAGSKAYGPIVGGLYGALSIALLDILVGRVGMWTLVTALVYGAIGVWGAYYLQNKKATARNFIVASIIGTLFFDVITGVLMGPIFYGQPFMVALLGQIPFTLRHLLGNAAFAGLLAPWFYKKVMENPKWEWHQILKFV